MAVKGAPGHVSPRWRRTRGHSCGAHGDRAARAADLVSTARQGEADSAIRAARAALPSASAPASYDDAGGDSRADDSRGAPRTASAPGRRSLCSAGRRGSTGAATGGYARRRAGVTSAVAAPSAAGIPLTHRGVASAFLVVSGHEDEAFASAIAQLQPNGVTVVVLMGLARSAAIASRLIDRGWSRSTPAAVIVDASTPRQQVWRGTLDLLAADAVDIDARGAGTIVIGDVVTVGLQEFGIGNLEVGMRTGIPNSKF